MKIYKLTLNLKLVLPRLKKFKLHEYNSENPIIFVQASDPDEACYRAIFNLAGLIFRQDDSRETISLFNDLQYEIFIIKVEIPNDEKFR
jgi:hypothetical protein